MITEAQNDFYLLLAKANINQLNLPVIEKGIKALFLDQLQFVKGQEGKKFGPCEEEVNYVSKELKSLAVELGIPIIALSQLSRSRRASGALTGLVTYRNPEPSGRTRTG